MAKSCEICGKSPVVGRQDADVLPESLFLLLLHQLLDPCNPLVGIDLRIEDLVPFDWLERS